MLSNIIFNCRNKIFIYIDIIFVNVLFQHINKFVIKGNFFYALQLFRKHPPARFALYTQKTETARFPFFLLYIVYYIIYPRGSMEVRATREADARASYECLSKQAPR